MRNKLKGLAFLCMAVALAADSTECNRQRTLTVNYN